MSHEAYWQAVVPEPRRVLHAELLPFSAGKIVLLHRVGLGARSIESFSEAELVTAVLVCGQPFGAACASLNDPATPAFLKRFRKRIGKFDLKEHGSLLASYIDDGSRFPLTYAPKQHKPENSITSLPFVQHVRCTLKHFYHVTDEVFWDMPWGLAQWDYFTCPVLNGTGDLVEKVAINDAQLFADVDFKRANPTLFDAAGNLKPAFAKKFGIPLEKKSDA